MLRLPARFDRHRARAQWLVALALVGLAPVAGAQGSPGAGWWDVSGGGQISTSGSLRLLGTTGQPDAAVLTGGPLVLRGGWLTMWTGGLTSGTGPADAPPAAFALRAPAPDPFTVSTVITFALPAESAVRAEVFGLGGQRVRTLAEGTRGAGAHHVVWDGFDQGGHRAAAGVYFVRVQAGRDVATRRVVRLD